MHRTRAWNVVACCAIAAALLTVDAVYSAETAHATKPMAADATSTTTATTAPPATAPPTTTTTTTAPPATTTPPTTAASPATDAPPAATPDTDPTPTVEGSWAAALQQVAAYAASRNGDVEVSVADLTTGAVIDAPMPQPPIRTASIIKVAIAVTLLRQDEAAGTAPTDAQLSTMTTMIENSNNDSAQALWDEIGGAAGIQPTLDTVGMSSTTPDDAAWGFTTTTAEDQARLLLDLDDGSLLSPTDTAQVLDMMRNVEADQQLQPAASAGLNPAIKNGWYPDADLGVWRVNCLTIYDNGIAHRFAISVLTRYDVNLGQAYGEQTCEAVASMVLATATNPAPLS